MPKIMYEFSSVMLQNTQNNSHGPGRRIRGVHVVTYRRDVVCSGVEKYATFGATKAEEEYCDEKCQLMSSRR